MIRLSNLDEYLVELSKQGELHFKPNPGNAGDALIACSIFQTFQRLKLRYKLLPKLETFDPAGKIIIYGGGGNLCTLYEGAAKQTALHCHPSAARFVILPSTISGNLELLESFGPNVDIFCRELTSYNYVRQVAKRARVYAADDCAMSLDVSEVFSARVPSLPKLTAHKILLKLINSERSQTVPSPRKVVEQLVWAFQHKDIEGGKAKTLNAFRTDRERLNDLPISNNHDVSQILDFGSHNKSLALYTTLRLLSCLNRFSVIRTNRLHVCIGAALLGKKVEFFPNNYFKCEAVYDFSLKHRFPNVTWRASISRDAHPAT